MKKTGKALQRRACLRGNTFHAKGSDPVTKETIMKTKATKKTRKSQAARISSAGAWTTSRKLPKNWIPPWRWSGPAWDSGPAQRP